MRLANKLPILLLLSANAFAAERLICPINEASGDDLCIYSRGIVFREDKPPMIKIKGTVIPLKVVSERVLKSTKPFPGLPGHKTETNYEGRDITVKVTSLVKSDSCYEPNEKGELVSADRCCGGDIQNSFVIRYKGEETKFTVTKWYGS